MTFRGFQNPRARGSRSPFRNDRVSTCVVLRVSKSRKTADDRNVSPAVGRSIGTFSSKSPATWRAYTFFFINVLNSTRRERRRCTRDTVSLDLGSDRGTDGPTVIIIVRLAVVNLCEPQSPSTVPLARVAGAVIVILGAVTGNENRARTANESVV